MEKTSVESVDLNKLSAEIHNVNVEKGFWEKPNDITTQRMLITSELYEAFEAHRKGKKCDTVNIFKKDSPFDCVLKRQPFTVTYYYSVQLEDDVNQFKKHIKDTIEDEIADTAIRLLDFGGSLELNFNKINTIGLSMFDGVNFIHDLDKLIETIRNFLKSDVLGQNILFCYACIQMFAEKHNIDLLTHIRLKLEYNKTRAYKHGKKY